VTPFAAGDEATIRYIWFGKISHARPVTVVRDTDDLIALYLQPGAACKACNPPGETDRYNDVLLAREWDLVDTEWKWSRVLMLARPDEWCSVWGFWGTDGGPPKGWYVNLEEPIRRSRAGYDTRDLQLDVVIMPDNTWTWKDEKEFTEMCDLGLISDEEASAVREQGERVIASIETDPWWLEWSDWAPDPSWPVPALRDGWDVVSDDQSPRA
jgi:hypothetical protein